MTRAAPAPPVVVVVGAAYIVQRARLLMVEAQRSFRYVLMRMYCI